jgi:hypothetical protein
VQDVEVAVGVGIAVLILVFLAGGSPQGGSSPSRHPPNQPGYSHDDVAVGDDEVVVTVGAGARVVVCGDFEVVFSPLSSLQPNHPGVLHVDVEDVDVLFDVVFVPVVVVSSRQPHQPGVLHVSVLVRVLLLADFDVAVGFEEWVVVVSVPLLSKYFQL